MAFKARDLTIHLSPGEMALAGCTVKTPPTGCSPNSCAEECKGKTRKPPKPRKSAEADRVALRQQLRQALAAE
jgi:hypothetical protein